MKEVSSAIGETEKTTQKLIKLNDLIPDLKKPVRIAIISINNFTSFIRWLSPLSIGILLNEVFFRF
jgi:hypothetical protein